MNLVNVNLTSVMPGKVCMRIVPVRVQAGGMEVTTYALLDNGSNKSLCTEGLLKALGVRGNPVSYNITTVNKTARRSSGVEAKLLIKPVDGDNAVVLDQVWSMESLNISLKGLPSDEEIQAWPHLTGIQVPQIEADEITLLIGSDVPEAFWVEEDRRGLRGEPYALKTPLGWSLLGPVSKDARQDKEAQMNFQHAEYDVMLQEKLELMWKMVTTLWFLIKCGPWKA